MSTPSRRNPARYGAISQATPSRTNLPYSEEGRNSSIASRRLRAARGNDEAASVSTDHQNAQRPRTRDQRRINHVITADSLHNEQSLAMGSSGHDQHHLAQPRDHIVRTTYPIGTGDQVSNTLGLWLHGQGELANRLFFPPAASLSDVEMLDYATETESGSMHTALMRDAWDDNSTMWEPRSRQHLLR